MVVVLRARNHDDGPVGVGGTRAQHGQKLTDGNAGSMLVGDPQVAGRPSPTDLALHRAQHVPGNLHERDSGGQKPAREVVGERNVTVHQRGQHGQPLLV